MKSGLKKFIVLFFVLVAASLLNKANAAVALTVTPSVVSNTYIGVITLQITGITNGEQVRIEKYIDPVSYTHLDVYKRQQSPSSFCCEP